MAWRGVGRWAARGGVLACLLSCRSSDVAHPVATAHTRPPLFTTAAPSPPTGVVVQHLDPALTPDVLLSLESQRKLTSADCIERYVCSAHVVGAIAVQGRRVGGTADAAMSSIYLTGVSASFPQKTGGLYHEVCHLWLHHPDSRLREETWLYRFPDGYRFAFGASPSEVHDRPPGFLSDYGRTKPDEDICSFFALRIQDPEALEAIASSDDIVRLKADLLEEWLDEDWADCLPPRAASSRRPRRD